MKPAANAGLGSAAGEGKCIVVGTAGHIDHGKTALVHALTGIDTDRLPEEKQRGITIDLGFASLDLQSSRGGLLRLSLIDVPGHHAFIRNMLAGTGGIDFVMLVIASDEGVKAQTEEHLAICSLLGIERGLVVLTKSDAVSEEHLLQTEVNVIAFLQGTFLQSAPVVAVSARTGAGIGRLKIALAEVAAAVPERSREFVPRLPLDRSFSIRGFGTVVTGTLQSGCLHGGDTVEQYPKGRLLRVRGLQVHGKSCQSAQAPCRLALNLAGVEVAQIGRGDTLGVPGMFAPTRVVDVELTLLARVPALKHGSRVRVHAFTSDTIARVLLFDQRDSSEPRSGLARLNLAKPLVLRYGDRLVLRQCSPAVTIGGARVLDPAVRSGIRKAGALAWLQALRHADLAGRLRLRASGQGMEGISLASLVTETGRTAEALRAALAPLVASGELVEAGGQRPAAYWLGAEALESAVRHAEAEMVRGCAMPRAELRSKTGFNAPVFQLVLERLIETGRFEIAGETIRAAGSAGQLPEVERRRLQALETAYANAGLAAPLLSEVARQLGVSPGELRHALTLLLRSKRLIRMGSDDAFVHPGALEKLYEKLRKHRGEIFDVGRFKTFTGLTRKHAIPLLEHLDQVRVTRNSNGARIVL